MRYIEAKSLGKLAAVASVLSLVSADDLRPVSFAPSPPALECATPATTDQSGMARCGEDRSSYWKCSAANGWIQDTLKIGSTCLNFSPGTGLKGSAPCCSTNGNDFYCSAPTDVRDGVNYC